MAATMAAENYLSRNFARMHAKAIILVSKYRFSRSMNLSTRVKNVSYLCGVHNLKIAANMAAENKMCIYITRNLPVCMLKL